jgi:alpha-tubulin suppressor-like RCC1 family protein
MAYCWGENNSGALGNGTYTARNSPKAVTMPPNVSFSAIAVSGSSSCALTTTGTAYCWGMNSYNGIGMPPPFINSMVPVAVTMPNGVSFATIAVDEFHACARTTTGTVYCWGDNQYGQLGRGVAPFGFVCRGCFALAGSLSLWALVHCSAAGHSPRRRCALCF